MEIRLLGPVQGWRDGARVELGPRQQRCVLAVLALEANRVVPVQRLVEVVWSGVPPRTAWQAVRVYVCRLRRVLDAMTRVGTEGVGYALWVDPWLVDVHRVETLVRWARTTGDDVAKVRWYRAALGLWRGPALADVTAATAGAGLARGWDELRLAVTEECLDAELRLGRQLAVVDELTGLVVRYPDRQRFVGQLMVALYRCGRAPDALRLFRDARARSVGEYGLDVEPRLRALELAVLRADPALDLGPSARGEPRTDGPESTRACLVDRGGCGRRSRRRSGKADEESIAALSATRTTPPAVVWAPFRAAEDPPDTP